jgi:uncharacterized protein involved in exopolysaccharide biosynthesis
MNRFGGTFAQRTQAVLDSPSDRLDHMVIAADLDPSVDLRYGNWRGFDLSGADLRGFNFTGADLTGARFDNAFIAGAIFDHAIYDPASLRKAADYEEFLRHTTEASLAAKSIAGATEVTRFPNNAPASEIGIFDEAPEPPWRREKWRRVFAGDDAAPQTAIVPAPSIAEILGTLRREWRFPLSGCLIGLMLAVGYIAFVPTLYKSSARILLDRSVTKYLQTNKIVDGPSYDEAEIASQVYTLSSESIAVPVVRSMNLAHDPEFVGSPNADGGLTGKVKKLIGWGDHADGIDPDAALEETAVENFLKRLSVYREDVANVISVTFSSEDPKKAAAIANSIVDTYIATTLESKLTSTKVVSQSLQDRLTDLKAQAIDADRALQNYKIAYTQLTNARVAVSEAKTRLDSINQMGGEGIMSTAATEALTKLRAEYRETAAKASELEISVGPRHLAVINLHKRMEELRKSIKDEEQGIADSYANEYQIAKSRESELAATMAQLVGEAGTSSQAQAKMRELESSADTLRNLYNSFAQKYNETLQAETIPVENARILTRATPLYKSSKNAAAVLAGSIIAGLFLGAVAAWCAAYELRKGELFVTKIIRIGMDTSKSVFVLHGVDAAEQPVLRRKLRRKQVLEFFAKLEPAKVGLEACGGAHYWARELRALGHEVVLVPPRQAVRQAEQE